MSKATTWVPRLPLPRTLTLLWLECRLRQHGSQYAEQFEHLRQLFSEQQAAARNHNFMATHEEPTKSRRPRRPRKPADSAAPADDDEASRGSDVGSDDDDDGSEEAPTLPDTAEAVAPNDAVAAVEGSDNLDGDAPGHVASRPASPQPISALITQCGSGLADSALTRAEALIASSFGGMTCKQRASVVEELLAVMARDCLSKADAVVTKYGAILRKVRVLRSPCPCKHVS